MIGIICSPKNENKVTKQLHTLLKSTHFAKFKSAIIFTITDCNLSDKTVSGSVVSRDKIEHVQTTLPAVIFNLSVEYRRTAIKKLRELAEVNGISVMNPANQINQCAIMDILLADEKTRDYVLPYAKYSKDDTEVSIPEGCNLLVKPENRPSLFQIAYIKPSSYTFDINSRQWELSCYRDDFWHVMRLMMPYKKWVILQTPVLVETDKGRLLIVRVYMQRRFNGEWTVITKKISPNKQDIHEQPVEKIDAISLRLIQSISCFIPDLSISYIDFVFDTQYNPYFLNLGGFDYKLINKNQTNDVQAIFYKNMLEYTWGFIKKPKGAFDYVG